MPRGARGLGSRTPVSRSMRLPLLLLLLALLLSAALPVAFTGAGNSGEDGGVVTCTPPAGPPPLWGEPRGVVHEIRDEGVLWAALEVCGEGKVLWLGDAVV